MPRVESLTTEQIRLEIADADVQARAYIDTFETASTSRMATVNELHKLVIFTANGAKMQQLPDDATATVAVGSWIDYISAGTGNITFAATGASVIQGTAIVQPGQIARAVKRSANTWLIGTTPIPTGGAPLIGKAAWFTALPTNNWFIPGDMAQPDGGWKEDKNGVLSLQPIDVGISRNLQKLGVRYNGSPQTPGTSWMGLWLSDANGQPTGLPTWTASVPLNVGNNNIELTITGSPEISPLIRRWIGFLNLSWAGALGEIKRLVPAQAIGGVDIYGTDGNAAMNAYGGSNFPMGRNLAGQTTINTDLTGVTLALANSRPYIVAKTV